MQELSQGRSGNDKTETGTTNRQYGTPAVSLIQPISAKDQETQRHGRRDDFVSSSIGLCDLSSSRSASFIVIRLAAGQRECTLIGYELVDLIP